MKKAILVGLDTKRDIYDINYSLDELEALAKECDIQSIRRITQKGEPNKVSYLGKGKLEEVLVDIAIYEPDLIIFNDELSPLMLKTITDFLNIEVIDRSNLILQIFLNHANTSEAKLEIKLAHLKYLLPRLSSLRDGFDRQAGIGSKGPGETQLELDRRKIHGDIIRLENELKEIHKMKANQIKNRKKNELKTVALVGYTNAGKSTTMNKIIDFTEKNSDKKVYSDDKLFATLSTNVRRISYKDIDFLLTDTVGFVSKLPTHLVHSFRQTLEEVKEADLIVIVLDISSKYAVEEFNVTMQILGGLNAIDKKTLVLLNKKDKLEYEPKINQLDYIAYSNFDDTSVIELLDYIHRFLLDDYHHMNIMIPYSDPKMLNFVIENTKVTSKIYLNNGISITLMSPTRFVKKIQPYCITDDYQN